VPHLQRIQSDFDQFIQDFDQKCMASVPKYLSYEKSSDNASQHTAATLKTFKGKSVPAFQKNIFTSL